MEQESYEYAGFWIRVAASLIDTLLFSIVIYPIIFMVYGAEYFTQNDPAVVYSPLSIFLSYILPIVVILTFWKKSQATPGKMLLSLKILDAETGSVVPMPRLVVRYVGYFVSAIVLLLGYIWVGFDAKKQGWHDKMAGTVVVRVKK
jgi:uncharacterized RDD family membrane protein YckC